MIESLWGHLLVFGTSMAIIGIFYARQLYLIEQKAAMGRPDYLGALQPRDDLTMQPSNREQAGRKDVAA